MGGNQFDQLYLAVRGNQCERVRELLSAHPSLASKRLPSAESWLHLAGRCGSVNVLSALLESDVDVDSKDDVGVTPLMAAVGAGKESAVSHLLAAGAEVNAKDKYGETALVVAVREGNSQIMEILVKHGAALDVLFGDGRHTTVVQLARDHGHHDLASRLVELGAPESPPVAAGKPGTDIDRLEAHVSKTLGQMTRQVVSGVEDLIDVHMVTVRANHGRNVLISSISPTDVGNGMIPPDDAHSDIQFAEVVVELPESWPMDALGKHPEFAWPISLMGNISWLPSSDNVWFGRTPLIVTNDDPPQPLAKGVAFTCTMLLKDATLPPLQTEYGKVVHFYTLIPLYTEERDFEREHGIAALLDLFENSGTDFTINPKRPNLLTHLRR